MNKIIYRMAAAVVLLSALALGACAPQTVTVEVPVVETVEVEVEVPVVETVEVEVPVEVEEEAFDCAGSTMAYASFGSQFAFIAIVDQSMRDAAEEAGVELVFLDNEFSPELALENAELIASRGDVDLVFEFNYYQQQNYVIGEIFDEAGIPVIAIDIPIPGAIYYGADNYYAGKLAGQGLVQYAMDNWDGQVDLVLVEQQSLAGQQTLEARTLGIIAGVQQSMPDLPEDLIVRFEGGVNVDEAQEAVATMLQANPDAERILIGMLGDSNAVAAATAAEQAGRADQVVASGQGGDDVAWEALRTGDPAAFLGTAAYRPETYGYDLIELGCQVLAGEQVPAEAFINHVFITADNIEEYYPE
jgi:ribose transport system substrate-binding protein